MRQFYGRLASVLQEKPMSIKFLVLGGGGVFWVLGGGEARETGAICQIGILTRKRCIF